MEEGGPEQDETMGCTLGTAKNAFLILVIYQHANSSSTREVACSLKKRLEDLRSYELRIVGVEFAGNAFNRVGAQARHVPTRNAKA